MAIILKIRVSALPRERLYFWLSEVLLDLRQSLHRAPVLPDGSEGLVAADLGKGGDDVFVGSAMLDIVFYLATNV